MKIFIDFDDVVFNTAAFKKELVKVFLRNGVSQKDFSLTYKDYPTVTRGGLKKYNPLKQISVLKRKLKISDSKIKKDLDKLLASSPKFVFRDAKPFLARFREKDLFLISYGETGFQRSKIVNCGLKRFFSKIIITDNLKSTEIGKIVKRGGERFVFIDDRTTQIDAVKKKFPQAVTFFVKRKTGRFRDKRSKCVDYEVKSLREVAEIIAGIES